MPEGNDPHGVEEPVVDVSDAALRRMVRDDAVQLLLELLELLRQEADAVTAKLRELRK